MHPIALTDAQLQIVLARAECVMPAWRSRFLENVADQLLPLNQITDADVAAAAAKVAARMPPCTA